MNVTTLIGLTINGDGNILVTGIGNGNNTVLGGLANNDLTRQVEQNGLGPGNHLGSGQGLIALGANLNSDLRLAISAKEYHAVGHGHIDAVDHDLDGNILVAGVGDSNITVLGGLTDNNLTSQGLGLNGASTLNGNNGLLNEGYVLLATFLNRATTGVPTTRGIGGHHDFTALEGLIGLNVENENLIIVSGFPLHGAIGHPCLGILAIGILPVTRNHASGYIVIQLLIGERYLVIGIAATGILVLNGHVGTRLGKRRSQALGIRNVQLPCANAPVKVGLDRESDLVTNLVLSDLEVINVQVTVGHGSACHEQSSKCK